MHSNNSEKAEEVQRDQEENYIEKEDPNNLINSQPQEEEPKEGFEPQEENRKIFVKNIPFSTTDEQFQDYFSKFGQITKAEIRKKENGGSMGMGFIVLANMEDKRILTFFFPYRIQIFLSFPIFSLLSKIIFNFCTCKSNFFTRNYPRLITRFFSPIKP